MREMNKEKIEILRIQHKQSSMRESSEKKKNVKLMQDGKEKVQKRKRHWTSVKKRKGARQRHKEGSSRGTTARPPYPWMGCSYFISATFRCLFYQ